jgi:mono/diheme cytochrome c family protein
MSTHATLRDPIMQLRNFAMATAFAIALPGAALAQQDSAAPATPAPQKEGAAAAKPFDVKNTFRNICGFCHEDYGRKQGKGPKLMDNPNSDEFLFKRIKNGVPGRMAAFGSAFSDDQIREIVKFIRALQPGVTP